MQLAERLRDPRRAWLLYLPLVAAVVLALLFGRGPRRCWPREQVLDAIRMVESGGRDDPPDGDGGLAIGPYQIHRVYWEDAVRAAPGLGGSYDDCRGRAYAERVVAAYMEYWVPDAWRDGVAEVIARVHNGGPTGMGKEQTAKYWGRVRAQLDRVGAP